MAKGNQPEDFPRKISAKEERRIRARKSEGLGPAYWLGMFGMVGWSVAVPAALFTLLGYWIDRKWPSSYSWTLMLLFAGMVLGIWNAWYWIRKESKFP